MGPAINESSAVIGSGLFGLRFRWAARQVPLRCVHPGGPFRPSHLLRAQTRKSSTSYKQCKLGAEGGALSESYPSPCSPSTCKVIVNFLQDYLWYVPQDRSKLLPHRETKVESYRKQHLL